jgi:hypothetical protein
MSSVAQNGVRANFEEQQLLRSLTVFQLRDVLMDTQLNQSNTGKARIKEEFISEIVNSPHRERLLTSAHRIEALTPFKHLFLYKIANLNEADRPLDQRVIGSFAKAAASFDPLHDLEGGFQVQVVLQDTDRSRLIIKFVHAVDSVDLISLDNDNYKKVRQKKRHPLVLTLHLNERLASISFPGYSQGNAILKQERVPYEKTVLNLVHSLARPDFGVRLEDLALKAPIEYLLKSYPEEISNIGRAVKQGGHDLSIRGGTESADVYQALLAVFPTLTKEIAEAGLRSAESPAMVLLWKKLGAVTRINLREGSPDILFIWRSSGASSTTIEQVIGRIREALEVAGKPLLAEAAEAINALRTGQIIQSSWLAQQFSLRQSESAALLINSVRNGLLQMRFRIRSEHLLSDFDNGWSNQLDDLPKEVTDENGTVIDASDPENVEVAYERVEKA